MTEGQVINKTTNSIEVSASAVDAKATADKPGEESGIDKIIFELKGTIGGQQKTITEPKSTTGTATHTFTGLTQNTPYTITAKAVDKAGNVSAIKEITGGNTSTVPGGDSLQEGTIKFEYKPRTALTEDGWTNNSVDVTITSTYTDAAQGGYKLQYAITDSATTQPQDGDWHDYNGTSVEMKTNGTIYARLRENISSGYQVGTKATATGNVSNIDKIKPEKPTYVTEITPTSITITAKAKDGAATQAQPGEESGVAKIIFALQGAGEPQEKPVTANKTEQASANCTFSALNESTEYTIIVKAVDKAGNESDVDNTKIVLAKANYSIINNGKQTYYEKLSEAYTEAVSNGGETGGGTIVVEKDVTEEFATSFEIAKTIQIDTNNKTLNIGATDDFQNSVDREGLILINSGTFTIKGSGNIACEESNSLMTAYGGNINIDGAVNIHTKDTAIILQHGYDSNLVIKGATITADEKRSTFLTGSGTRRNYRYKDIC